MIKYLKFSVALILAFSIGGCSVVGIRTAEELKYDVISKSGDIEIREYQPYIEAVTSMQGTYKEVQGDLFRTLAAYIFGKNTTDSTIAMTAPVKTNPELEESNEQIAMTAPVVLEPAGVDTWKMAFSMPSKYTMDNLPKPLDPAITLAQVPAKKIAVIQFTGSFDDLEKRRKKA